MIIYQILKKVHFFCVKIKKTVDMYNFIVYHINQAQQKCAEHLSLFNLKQHKKGGTP